MCPDEQNSPEMEWHSVQNDKITLRLINSYTDRRIHR